MGANSTAYISKEKAISFIHSHLSELNNASLEEILDIWLREKLYNARIDEDGRDNDILKFF